MVTKQIINEEVVQKWLDSCVTLLEDTTNHTPSSSSRAKITEMLYRFGYNQVYRAIMKAFDNYYIQGDIDTWGIAFSKIGGICHNESKKWRD
jgi:hypothetical protein